MRQRRKVENLICKFLDEVQDLSLQEMIRVTDQKLELVKSELKELQLSYGITNEFNIKLRFYRDLKGFKFFLVNFQQPKDFTLKRFKLFYWVTQKLIQKREIDPEVISIFESI